MTFIAVTTVERIFQERWILFNWDVLRLLLNDDKHISIRLSDSRTVENVLHNFFLLISSSAEQILHRWKFPRLGNSVTQSSHEIVIKTRKDISHFCFQRLYATLAWGREKLLVISRVRLVAAFICMESIVTSCIHRRESIKSSGSGFEKEMTANWFLE